MIRLLRHIHISQSASEGNHTPSFLQSSVSPAQNLTIMINWKPPPHGDWHRNDPGVDKSGNLVDLAWLNSLTHRRFVWCGTGDSCCLENGRPFFSSSWQKGTRLRLEMRLPGRPEQTTSFFFPFFNILNF
jgi:hypothetical protein